MTTATAANRNRTGYRPQRDVQAGASYTKEFGGEEKGSFAIPGGQCKVKGPGASLTATGGTGGLNVTGAANFGSIECESSFEKGGFKGTVRGTAAIGAEVTAGTSPGACVGVPMNLSGTVSHGALPNLEVGVNASVCLGWPPAAKPK